MKSVSVKDHNGHLVTQDRNSPHRASECMLQERCCFYEHPYKLKKKICAHQIYYMSPPWSTVAVDEMSFCGHVLRIVTV